MKVPAILTQSPGFCLDNVAKRTHGTSKLIVTARPVSGEKPSLCCACCLPATYFETSATHQLKRQLLLCSQGMARCRASYQTSMRSSTTFAKLRPQMSLQTALQHRLLESLKAEWPWKLSQLLRLLPPFRSREDFKQTLQRRLRGHRVARRVRVSVLPSRCRNGLRGVFLWEQFSQPS